MRYITVESVEDKSKSNLLNWVIVIEVALIIFTILVEVFYG